MDYLILIIGLMLLLLGANVLVDSTVAIAKKARLSNFVIGFTIIGAVYDFCCALPADFLNSIHLVKPLEFIRKILPLLRLFLFLYSASS